jgi:hypothetical protein
MLTLVLIVVALGVGFALGRVKNAAKLKEVQTVVDKYEAIVTADFKAVIAEVKSKL